MSNILGNKITRAEMKDALLRSGYLLELRVESKLKKWGGTTETNATYSDQETGKSREFDLYSLKSSNAALDDLVYGCLLIECINNPQPLTILTKSSHLDLIEYEKIKIAGLPVKIPNKLEPNWWRNLPEYLRMANYHHYWKGRVGTQYCSFIQKKSGSKNNSKEWMATHDDSHYESFRKLCDVTDFYIDKHWDFIVTREKDFMNLEFFYPLVIVQGDLIEAYQTARSVKFRAVNHIQFRQSIAKNRNRKDYRIDVIKESYLPEYLKIIDAELDKTSELIHNDRVTINLAIERIVKEAKSTNLSESVRKIMDYTEPE